MKNQRVSYSWYAVKEIAMYVFKNYEFEIFWIKKT